MSQFKQEIINPETLRYIKNLRLKEDISSEERQILNQTVRVDKGLLGEVVTMKKEKNDLLYICHICGTFKMVWPYFVQHLNGNNHKLNLKIIYHPKKQFPITYPNENLKKNLKTKPLPVCKVQEELDNSVLPLIGLEYLVEIVVPDGSLLYQCLLCNKKSSNLIMDHLICQGHYMRYLSIFFPTVTKFLKKKKKVIGGRIITKKNTADVVAEIQQEYGLLKPRSITYEQMETSLDDVLDSIDKGPHFWETPTRTFLEDINSGGFQQSNLNKGKSKIHDKQIMPLMNVIVSPPKLKGLTHNTHERLAEERYDEDERRFDEFIQADGDTQLWQNYRERVKQIEDDLYNEMTYYEQNPKKHPKFEIEWKIYLSERIEDVLRNGEDPRMYNIKDEFLVLWQIKLRERFNIIFQNKKAHLRQEIEFLPCKSLDNAWLQIEFEDYKKSTSNKRDYGSLSYENKFSSPDPSNKRIKGESVGSMSDVSVIHILRQLSVLEANLGSLGPKVVDLLSQAILLEKTLGADSVLSNEENCVMLETVKEKLIGLLQAKMMEQSMIGIARIAICNITDLLLKVSPGKDNHNDTPSFSGTRPSYDEKLNFNGRKPYQDENKPYTEYRKPYLDERQPYQDEKKPYMEDRKPYLDERHPYQDERKPEIDQSKPYPFEIRSYPDKRQLIQDKRNSFSDVRKPYPDDRNCYLDKEKTYEDERNSFSDKRIPQIKKTYKLSEIHYIIENLRFLLELSYVEKAAMAHGIASSLILRRQTEITEDDLLVMINTYKSKKQEPRNEFCGKQSTDINQQRLSGYNKFTSADNVSPKSSSAIPSLFDVPAYGTLDDLFTANQSSYSSYGQEIQKSYFPGSDHNPSESLSYSFNTNPYPSDSYRKY